jgi:predicted nucleic acid-binding protein
MLLTHLADTDVCIKVQKKRDRDFPLRFRSHHDNLANSDILVFELYARAEKLRRKA